MEADFASIAMFSLTDAPAETLTPYDLLKREFCRAYQAWVTAERSYMAHSAICHYWEIYVKAREAWITFN